MEFVVVSKHQGLTLPDYLKSMQVLSVPDAYFVYMGCESTDEYIASIVTCTFDLNDESIVSILKDKRYAPINGKIVFRHVRSMRTATIIFAADGTYDEGSIYLISKIRHIQWQDDDEVVLVLGIVCAEKALNAIKSKAVLRNDMKYIAVPCANLQISANAKSQLEFLKCEHGVNVAYSTNGCTQTHRSVLFPISLLSSELPDLSGEKYWAYADFLNPRNPVFLQASPAWLQLIGLDELRGDLRTLLETHMCAAEVQRLMSTVLPQLQEIEQGTSHSDDIEFVTVRGRERFACRWYKTRSIVVGIVSVPDDL